MSIKVFNVEGTHLPSFEDITTRDFVFDTAKQFFTDDAKSFLQNFKPNAKVATHLSDTTKGIVSDVARVANEALQASWVGVGKARLLWPRQETPAGGGVLLADPVPLWSIRSQVWRPPGGSWPTRTGGFAL